MLICTHSASIGATQSPAFVQLRRVLRQSCEATSPLTGHCTPAGVAPEPLQTGPEMQYVASPTTDTLVQSIDVVVGLGVAELVVGAGVTTVGDGVAGVVGAGVAVCPAAATPAKTNGPIMTANFISDARVTLTA